MHITALSENMIDIKKGFVMLKEINYDLKVVVSDESMGEIAKVAKEIFPEVIIQTCLTHYEKCIERCFQVNGIKRRIRTLERKLHLMKSSFLVSTHHYDRRKAIEIINEIGDLESKYYPLIDVQNIFHEIFWGAGNEKDITRLENLLNIVISGIPSSYEYFVKIKDRYLDYYKKRNEILAFLLHPELDIPKTTNLIEGFNSTGLELRLSSIRGFEKEQFADNYINALILKYRFHKFTDCKGKFKDLNGKSPLQIANPKKTFNFNFLSRGQDWIRFCQELKDM